MMTYRYCGFFKAGDDVPSWFMDADPRNSDGQRPRIKFTIDCHLVEVSQGYFAIPDTTTKTSSILHVEGGSNANIFAASRPAILPFSFQILHPEGDGPDGDDDRGPTSPIPGELATSPSASAS